MADKTNRRKKFLINPDFQIKFMKNLLLLNIAICSVFYFAHSFFFWQGREMGKSVNLPADHVFFRFLDDQQSVMNIISFTTMCVISILILAFGLLYSHKIAGPIYRLQKYLNGKSNGTEKGQLSFRKGDYFPELADSVNDYIHKSTPVKGKSKKAA